MFGLVSLAPSPSPAPSEIPADWLSAATFLSSVIAVITLVGVVGSIVLGRLGQKQDRELSRIEADRAERAQRASEASAERAEAAAALNIDALTRIADVLETSIVSALERSARLAAKPDEQSAVTAQPFASPARVKWSLRHFQGDKYNLENIGDATAFNVRVAAHESLLQPKDWPSAERLDPGEVLDFFALKTMGTVDSTVTIRWTPTESEDEVGTWRYPLPPRPPRR